MVIKVLAERVRRVEELPAQMQPDLYLGLAIFSSLRFTRELILKIIEVGKMEASPLFDGIRDKWIDQGEKKGIHKGWVEAITDALKENTGSCPDDVQKKLHGIQDLDKLKVLLRRAVKTEDIDEFIEALNTSKANRWE